MIPPQALIYVGLLLVGCKEDEETATTPPRIAEPVAGATVECCLVRVRINPPSEGVDIDGKIRPLEPGGPHAAWRVNGGPSHEVQFASTQRERGGLPYVFAAELVPGKNLLEVGRCDEFDLCGWTSISLTATVRIGSPDPTFARTGQLVLGDTAPGVLHVDGPRTLFAVETSIDTQIRSLGADGEADTAFGNLGVAKIPWRGVRDLVPTFGGNIFVRGDWFLGRLTAAGAVDASFGTAGMLEIPSPTGGAIIVDAMTELADANLVLAGVTADQGLGKPFVMVLSPDGAVVDYHLLPTPTGSTSPQHAVVTRTGDVAILTSDSVYRATIGGPVMTFGSGGILALGSQLHRSARIAFSGDHVVVASLSANAADRLDARVLDITPDGQPSTVMVPFDTEGIADKMALAATADGTIYVAATAKHAANPMKSWLDAPLDGSDIAVARIRNGVIDTSFGDAGIALVSFMNAWRPVAVETLLDTPVTMAIAADGAPLVLAASTGAAVDLWNTQFNLGPGTAVVQLRR